jgi:hypothetical protein
LIACKSGDSNLINKAKYEGCRAKKTIDQGFMWKFKQLTLTTNSFSLVDIEESFRKDILIIQKRLHQTVRAETLDVWIVYVYENAIDMLA